MKISEKLKIIIKIIGITQEKLAQKFGVSFPTLNSWINEKSNPRSKLIEKIDILYLEITGQNIIPNSELQAKKNIIFKKSKSYKKIIDFIVNRKDLYEQFLVSLTYNTNSIEGSTLTEIETSQILFQNKIIKNKTLIEQLEAKNHQSALNFLFTYLKQENNTINEKLILKLHSILMNSIIENAGIYRNHGVRILQSNIVTANYMKIPILMEQLSQDFEKDNIDIIKNIAIIHSLFEKIHPFSDGNGRVGRLLIHAMLLKKGIPPALIKQNKKHIYYKVLNIAQQKEDYSLLENFICDSILNSFKIIELK